MFGEIKGLNEECGIVGIWDHEEAASLAYVGLHTLQHRGQEGAGIVVKNKSELTQHKGLGLASEVFSKDILSEMIGTSAIGHVRYTTTGSNILANVQPFLFHFSHGSMALCHNGNITNAKTLRKNLEQNGSIFHSSSDTEVLAHLITKSNKNTLVDKIKDAFNKIKGGFAFIIFTDEQMIAAMDPNGFRPLSIGKLGKSYIVASETCVFDTMGADFVKDVKPGELVIIDDTGISYDKYTEDTNLAVCSMEFIYFARPDSNIHGVNVHKARKSMGKVLATEFPIKADVVCGVPDSGISAAIGYAEESGIPYEIGLIKNRYVARTFIQPSQALREQGVKMKLSAVRGVVSGKSVIVVDDSIVRGTTSKRIVQLLREAGAAEVHFKVSSPPLIYPCFYGIDIQTTRELIAYEKSIEEIKDFIGADSLGFISQQGLINAVNMPVQGKYRGLCMAYFNGDYPTDLYDYEEEMINKIKPNDLLRR